MAKYGRPQGPHPDFEVLIPLCLGGDDAEGLRWRDRCRRGAEGDRRRLDGVVTQSIQARGREVKRCQCPASSVIVNEPFPKDRRYVHVMISPYLALGNTPHLVYVQVQAVQ
jgi:hypothetical protein